jgi:hypothetical protein
LRKQTDAELEKEKSNSSVADELLATAAAQIEIGGVNNWRKPK